MCAIIYHQYCKATKCCRIRKIFTIHRILWFWNCPWSATCRRLYNCLCFTAKQQKFNLQWIY